MSTCTDQIKLSFHIQGQVRWFRSETLNQLTSPASTRLLGGKQSKKHVLGTYEASVTQHSCGGAASHHMSQIFSGKSTNLGAFLRWGEHSTSTVLCMTQGAYSKRVLCLLRKILGGLHWVPKLPSIRPHRSIKTTSLYVPGPPLPTPTLAAAATGETLWTSANRG